MYELYIVSPVRVPAYRVHQRDLPSLTFWQYFIRRKFIGHLEVLRPGGFAIPIYLPAALRVPKQKYLDPRLPLWLHRRSKSPAPQLLAVNLHPKLLEVATAEYRIGALCDRWRVSRFGLGMWDIRNPRFVLEFRFPFAPLLHFTSGTAID